MSQFNPVHALLSCRFNVRCSIDFPSMPFLSNNLSPLVFIIILLYEFLLYYTFYIPFQSHPSSFDHPNILWIYEPTHLIFSTPCCHVISTPNSLLNTLLWTITSFTHNNQILTKFWCFISYCLRSHLTNGHTKSSAPKDVQPFPHLNPPQSPTAHNFPPPLPLTTYSPYLSQFYPPFCSPHNYFLPHSVRPVPRQTSFSESNEPYVFFTILLALPPYVLKSPATSISW